MIIGPHIIIMMNYDVSLIFVHDILSTFGALQQLPRFQKCIFGLSGNISTDCSRIDIAPINQRPPG